MCESALPFPFALDSAHPVASPAESLEDTLCELVTWSHITHFCYLVEPAGIRVWGVAHGMHVQVNCAVCGRGPDDPFAVHGAPKLGSPLCLPQFSVSVPSNYSDSVCDQ